MLLAADTAWTNQIGCTGFHGRNLLLCNLYFSEVCVWGGGGENIIRKKRERNDLRGSKSIREREREREREFELESFNTQG